MNFTDEQFNALAPFESRFTTLIRSHYVSYVGFGNAKRIDAILKEAGLTPAATRTNYACAECVKRLVEKAARAWFEDKQARIDAANDAEAAKTMTEPVEECDENTIPKPKKSTRKAAKK